MKYEVDFSCGHTGKVELYGKSEDRNKRIKYLEKYGICPECYKEQIEIEKSIGHKEVKMSYMEYKKNYADCKTKSGSYDGEEKTITVYIPKI